MGWEDSWRGKGFSERRKVFTSLVMTVSQLCEHTKTTQLCILSGRIPWYVSYSSKNAEKEMCINYYYTQVGSFFFKRCACVLSHVQCFPTPWTAALQAPLSMGFSRQEYRSGLPSPPPGDLSDLGI